MRELVDASVLTMAPQYPELNDEINRIRSIAVGEEAAFLQTLRTGTTSALAWMFVSIGVASGVGVGCGLVIGVGRTLGLPFAGVHVIEATKQVFRPIAAKKLSRAMQQAEPVLVPSRFTAGQ